MKLSVLFRMNQVFDREMRCESVSHLLSMLSMSDFGMIKRV